MYNYNAVLKLFFLLLDAFHSIFRPYWAMLGMSEVLEQVAAVSEQLVQYDLHNEELLLLQATVLANAGMYFQ